MENLSDVPNSKSKLEPVTIGKRMRNVREYLKLSQREFAKVIGVYPARVSEVETGIIVASTHMITQIGKLGFDLNWFVLGKDKGDCNLSTASNVPNNILLTKLIADIKCLDARDIALIVDIVASFKKHSK